MIKITEFLIKRYRSINELKLNITEDYNISTICGQNNVDKTNVLRAISLFFDKIEFIFKEDVPEYFEQSKLDIARGIFNVYYNGRTMHEFLTWCCNYCIELGLVERIKSTFDYDQVFLTPLGIEVNNIFSLDLTLKKSRLNLSFKFLE